MVLGVPSFPAENQQEKAAPSRGQAVGLGQAGGDTSGEPGAAAQAQPGQ